MNQRSLIVVAPLRIALCAGVLAVGLVPGACSKSGEAEKPAGIPAQAPAAQPTSPAAAAPPAPVLPPSPPPAAEPAAPAAPPPAPAAAAEPAAKADPKAAITGEIVLASSMKNNVKKEDVIYLVARRISDNPTARGSLVAVKKFSAASFPIPFTLNASDMMFQNGAFDGDLALSVRVDKDGDPMSRRKGDVFGGLPKVRVGAKAVKLSLNTLQKEDESLAAPGTNNPHAPDPGKAPLPKGHP